LSIWHIALIALAVNLLCSGLVWLVSLVRGNAGLVDRVWSILILLPAGIYVSTQPSISSQSLAMLAICGFWAVRLSIFITWRGWGKPEDRRYAEIRQRNQPNFAYKSLYLVFELQAVLAWLVATPFLAVAATSKVAGDWSWLDYFGLGLALFGFVFETLADAQMTAFQSKRHEKDAVMQTGLWRYSRHPNYFGESCVWWGLSLFAVSAGAWWALLSPVLITFLLIRVSGINLQEKNTSLHGPAYTSYLRKTSAFVPWPPSS
jgi:steroid 5-alpha reductase family enzyme